MFLFVCVVCVCLCVCLSVSANGDAPTKTNTFKPTDFKFDVHVPRDSPDMTPEKFPKQGAWPESYDSLKFTWRI